MAESPKISVIITTYNSNPDYLKLAIESVLNQTYTNFEVIIVDDGSKTNTSRELSEKYKLKFIRQENAGVSAARNTGIRNSSGDLIAILDDDDLWLPDKLKKQVQMYNDLVAKSIEPGILSTGVINIDQNGNHLSKGLRRVAGCFWKVVLFQDYVVPSSMIVPKKVFDDIGLFDENLRYYEDTDITYRIAQKYPSYSINDYLVKYRVHSENISKNTAIRIAGSEVFYEKVFKNDAWITEELKKRIIENKNYYNAIALKESAYTALFVDGNGKLFRKLIMLSKKHHKSSMTIQALIYYALSYFSASLCRNIKKLKKNDIGHPDVDLNVKDMEDGFFNK